MQNFRILGQPLLGEKSLEEPGYRLEECCYLLEERKYLPEERGNLP